MPVTVNGKCHVCGHTWDAVVGSRSLGRGCPACGGQIVIKGKNDLATKFPEIAAEWDYEKNAPITPDGVSFGAIKKYSWICPKCGYSYDASLPFLIMRITAEVFQLRCLPS